MLGNTPRLNQLIQLHILHPNKQITLQTKHNTVALKNIHYLRTSKKAKQNKISLFTQLLANHSKQSQRVFKPDLNSQQSINKLQKVQNRITYQKTLKPLDRQFTNELNKKQGPIRKQIIKQNIYKDYQVKESFSQFFQRQKIKQESNNSQKQKICSQKQNINQVLVPIQRNFTESDIFFQEKDTQTVQKQFFPAKKKDKNQSQQQSLESMLNAFQFPKRQSFLKFKVCKPLILQQNNANDSKSQNQSKGIILQNEKCEEKQPIQVKTTAKQKQGDKIIKKEEQHLLKPLRICEQSSQYESKANHSNNKAG